MKIVMIGEAARHKNILMKSCRTKPDIAALPTEAAFSSEYDSSIESADFIITLKYHRTSPKKGSTFRVLQIPGAGLDDIDKDSLPQDCVLCNVYEHQIPISEYVITAMLEWELRFTQMRQLFNSSKWSSVYWHRAPHGELYGKTLLLIGFGRIAREIAKRAKAFEMRIYAVDKYAHNSDGYVDVLADNSVMNEMLKDADYVVLACPLTKETHGMIDAARLSAMKKTAVLINISRGMLIAEADLYDALAEKRIGGAVLDVWWQYPSSESDLAISPAAFPFHSLDNVICTPHSSAWTEALMLRRYGIIAKNIDAFSMGKPLLNVVGVRDKNGFIYKQ